MKRILLLFAGLLVLGSGLGLVQGNQARLRVAHLSPDAPAVDVWVNGVRVLSRVSYKNVGAYLTVRGGVNQVWVMPAGQVTPRLIDTRVTLEAGRSYTVAAVGLAKDVQARLFLDEIATPPEGSANVRLVHASPDAPPVDAVVPGEQPLLLRNNLKFGEATPYVAIPARSYQLEVRPTGTATATLNLPDVRLEPGRVYSVFIVGSMAASSLEAVLVLDNPLTAGQ